MNASVIVHSQLVMPKYKCSIHTWAWLSVNVHSQLVMPKCECIVHTWAWLSVNVNTHLEVSKCECFIHTWTILSVNVHSHFVMPKYEWCTLRIFQVWMLHSYLVNSKCECTFTLSHAQVWIWHSHLGNSKCECTFTLTIAQVYQMYHSDLQNSYQVENVWSLGVPTSLMQSKNLLLVVPTFFFGSFPNLWVVCPPRPPRKSDTLYAAGQTRVRAWHVACTCHVAWRVHKVG